MQSIRQFLPGIVFILAMMTTSFEVSAQNSRNYNKSDKNRDRKEYRNDHSNRSDYSTGRNDEHYGDKSHFKVHNRGRDDRDYGYNQGHSNENYHAQQGYYNHPQYGRVYRRFEDRPIVFRHSHGDYYYHGNQFYTYRDGVGYCPAESPRGMYFSDLPFDCNRVQVNGQVFFRHDDLYFSHSTRGYAIVPSPLEVNFSLRF